MDGEREGEDPGRGDWGRRAHGHAARHSDQGVAEPRAGGGGGGERASGGRGRRRRNRGVRSSGGERSEEHTCELQSQSNVVCRLLLEKKTLYLLSTACLPAIG